MARLNRITLASLRRQALYVFLVGFFSAGPALGQQALTIRMEPTCTTCRIRLVHSATLGPGEVGDYIDATSLITRTRAGFVFVRSLGGTEIVDAAHDGSMLGVTGRAGQGPGEYGMIRAIVSDASDSLYVFDGRNLRMTVLGPSRELVRTVALPAFTHDTPPLLLPDGSWILNTLMFSADQVGRPLHRMAAEGQIVRSFGGVRDETRLGRVVGTGQIRRLALDRDGSIWAAHLRDYRVDQFDDEGDLVTTLSGVPWWETLSISEARTGRPLGAVIGISIMSDGHLLLLSRVADPEWAEHVTRRGRGGYSVDDYGGYYDSVIDVIDPATGELIQSQVFDEFILAFLDPATVAAVQTTVEGYEYMDIYRLFFSRSP